MQASRQNTVSREMMEYSQAKNIGLLFTGEENDYQVFNQLVKRLGNEGKQVKALTYFEQMQSSGYDFNFDYFTKEQISATGNIKSEKVSRFIENRFDYLFCILRQSFLPFDYILLQSKARYRIGLSQEEKPECFEFMMKPQPEQSLSEAIDQLLQYTQALTLQEGYAGKTKKQGGRSE
jgi:pentatricopeptide repeat protein